MPRSTEEVIAEKRLSDWIDRDVIAENIMAALKDANLSLTLENGRAVWLDILYTEMPEALRVSVAALANKGEIH
jgi:hypothetical protein